MSWKKPLEADARIAARNAVKIRAALRQTVDSKTIFQAYQATQPQPSGNLAQDRARARAWAIINVRVNMEALKLVLIRVWATGYILGTQAADELIAKAKRRAQKATEINKAELESGINWEDWEAGDEISALILKPSKAFKRLLERQGITLKEMSNTTIRDIGNAIGEAIALGLSPTQAATLINRSIADPSRALTIAITEQNRAISYATISRYQEAGLQEMEWVTSDPCDLCADNDGEVVEIGGMFPSGDTQPPVHPHCRCALLPVIPNFDAPNYTGGSILTLSSMPSEKEQPVRVRHINPHALQIEWVD
jgi:SPP1 gp7 family putative phage head morphogenesis protein